MKTKPRKLDFLAAFLVALAPLLPIQIMILYGHTPFEIEAIAAKLTPLNWAIFVLAPITGFLVWRASVWVLAALPALTGLVAYNNWFVGRLGMDFSPWMTDVATLVFIGACGTVLTRDVLPVLLHPRRRWWLTPTRKEAEVQVRVQIHDKNFRKGVGDEFYTTTFDISEGGAFIPFGRERRTPNGSRQPARAAPFNANQMRPGTQCFVCINVRETDMIQCRAEIVRVAQDSGHYPAGMGIRFLGLSWDEKRALVGFLKILPNKARQAAPVPARA